MVYTILNGLYLEACNLIPRIYPVIQPENPRLLRVAILGPANSGKSTLLNSIMKEKVCMYIIV